jgi:hypothetical protein
LGCYKSAQVLFSRACSEEGIMLTTSQKRLLVLAAAIIIGGALIAAGARKAVGAVLPNPIPAVAVAFVGQPQYFQWGDVLKYKIMVFAPDRQAKTVTLEFERVATLNQPLEAPQWQRQVRVTATPQIVRFRLKATRQPVQTEGLCLSIQPDQANVSARTCARVG